MPRRGDNIRKRKDGRWEARYPLPVDTSGDRRYGSVYGRSYQEAKEKRDRVLTHPQVVQASTQLRVEDLLYAWQDSNRIRLKESSVSRYQNLIDTHILPDIGSLNVGMLAELNYKIGMMYFNYYTNDDGTYSFSNRVQKAYPFFAANYENQQISADFAEKSLSDCYYQICSFYKKYILSSATVEEASRDSYQALFNTITSTLEDVEGAGAYDQLTLYNGTFMLLYDQRSFMVSVNVDEATVLDLLETVFNSAKSLSVQKEQSKKLQQEIVDNYAT